MIFTFSQEAGMFRRSNSNFIVEAVVPNFGHIVPIIDDTVLNRIG